MLRLTVFDSVLLLVLSKLFFDPVLASLFGSRDPVWLVTVRNLEVDVAERRGSEAMTLTDQFV